MGGGLNVSMDWLNVKVVLLKSLLLLVVNITNIVNYLTFNDSRRRRAWPGCRKCRADTSHVASTSAHVGRATASEAGWLSEVAAPRVGPRLLLHVRQKSKWRIDRAARET